ncbi:MULTISPECIES: N-acetylmuramoyl-L-alanine amidase family protein [unclassified Streptococcus]|uniref:N-acetylmuramoyl-L-alanine amidase family protein n=1 Tax=unclassified Streptococcus TaxID=2608887 RepID=UPI0015674BC8|nr:MULTISPECIES: N-acetylmuramoyl-L-alanine amidase family protein [unclassified Streptococcus]
MKKEMKHALVALGLSTLLVPTFASQVVSAQEESHETTTSVSPEEVNKKIEETKQFLIDLIKQNIFEQVDQGDWDTVSFSKSDVSSIRDKLREELNYRLQDFMGELEYIRKYSLEGKIPLEELPNILSEFKNKSKKNYIDRYREKDNFFGHRMKYIVAELAILKKMNLVISQINNDSHYTELEKKEMLARVSSYYAPGFHQSGLYVDSDKYLTLFNNQDNLNTYLKKVSLFLSNNHYPISTVPKEKNIREINAVAFMEKTAISNDDTLSKAEKISMFSKIDDIVEEGIHKVKKEAGLLHEEKPELVHMLSPEELSVFTKRIEDVYQGKAKPKVTKEEAIQAVSTGTSSSVLSQSKSNVTTNGETKKNHQASKWFKESGKWYYNDLSGNLVRNRWVGRYYLKADASMAASEWIYDEDYKSWFYVDSTGSYVEKAWQGEYYLKRGGYMAKSEWVFDSQYDSWYYLNQDGKYARNQWIKDGDKWYYLLADGKLAKNMTINGYKVNEKGEWV